MGVTYLLKMSYSIKFLLLVMLVTFFNNLMFNNNLKINENIPPFNSIFLGMESYLQNNVLFSQSFLNLSLKSNVSENESGSDSSSLSSSPGSRPSSILRPGPMRPSGSRGSKRMTGSTGSTGPTRPAGPVSSTSSAAPTRPMGSSRSTGPSRLTGPVGSVSSTSPTTPTRPKRSLGSASSTRSSSRSSTRSSSRSSTRPSSRVLTARGPKVTANAFAGSYDEEVRRLQSLDINDDKITMVSVTCQELIDLQELLVLLLDMFVVKASDFFDFSTFEECLKELLKIKEMKNLSLYPTGSGKSLLLKGINKVSKALESQSSLESKLQSLLLKTVSIQDIISNFIFDCTQSASQSILVSSTQYSIMFELYKEIQAKMDAIDSFSTYSRLIAKNYCDQAFILNVKYLILNMKKKVAFMDEPLSSSKAKKPTSTKKSSKKSTTQKSYMEHTLSSSAKVRKKYGKS
ncbi:putative low complexity [Cryptosporidium sp. chipmunk genotype I]|uniref:putative low complexity n=1 Tax=Cryptosporidium sp. chipmunk genotype I TaxID=1280935 RepID=UPI003519E582|nr:putative low complexity [Cryptosporidium sp. chipmunk genotype I]